jgi:hypothetical protein
MAKKLITITVPTVATAAGSVNGYGISPGGRLVSAIFSGVDALAAHDTNYASFALKNLGQAGAGTTDMLSTADANTTKITGGSALAANTKRALTLSSTLANRDTLEGDRLKFIATGAGTLANTVTEGRVLLTFQRRS